MEEKNTVDLSEIQAKIDSQNKLLETIRDELQKANKREEDKLADEKKQKEEVDKKEQERLQKGELTTDEQILKEIQLISSNSQIQNKSIDDLMSKIETGNNSADETSKQLRTLVEVEQNNSQLSETQTNLFVTYAVVLIPIFVVLYFIYKFFRQFI